MIVVPSTESPSGTNSFTPPTFLIYCNDPELAHFTYMRFLENQIRREYPFIGTPIRLVLKKRERTERS